MKITSFAFIALMAMLTLNTNPTQAQERSYDGAISTTPVRVQQKGDVLHVEVDFILHNVKVKSAGAVELIPQLIAPEDSMDLPKVSLMGRNEFMAHERRITVMSRAERERYEEPYAVVKDYKRKSDTIPYRYMLPYEPWMANARLEIKHDKCGCGLTKLMEVEPVAEVVTEPSEPYKVVPHMAYIQPEAEEIKHREMQAEVFLDFVVDKIDIRPEYMNNPRELAKIYRIIDELKSDPDVAVNRLDIIGYASPEGTLKRNKWLSEGRAKALRDLLAVQYDFPRDIYRIEFGGENWDGLVAVLNRIDMEHKEEVLDIINTYSIEQGRETKLMKLRGGVPYRWMLRNIFPTLRVAICKVQYSIKNFNLEEAKEVFKKRPQNLSLNEMFLVASSYPIGSEAFIDVFETAVRMFPNDETANLNAAAAALSRNDSASAERYLNRITAGKHLPEYKNAMGVLYLLKGDYTQAETLLQEAANAGLEAAKINVEELNKQREYNSKKLNNKD